MSTETLNRLLSDDVLIPILVATGVVLLVGIKSLASVIKATAKERTRREIAAFIAEGSMTPEQGERLMRAGAKDTSC